MDPLTKHVARRLKAQPAPGPHPAPELLSAFAENALPEADRGALLLHLGACSDCREILFLALPESADAQKVLVLKPGRFRRWGLAWGAAVAAVAIAAVVFNTGQLGRKDQSLKTAATTAPAPEAETPEAETKIADETTSLELDRMQAAREARAGRKATALAEKEIQPQPEAKHMTGKMQAPLVFDQSGEVHVQTAVGQQTADQAYAISQPTVSTSQAEASNAPSPAAPAPDLTATSSLEGVIVDQSGAVVSNAKVTTVGPAGAKIATSDSEGRFSFDQLPPGFYSIKAEAGGFKAAEITQVAVLDSKASNIRVTLDVGTASDVVEVTGAAAEIDSSNGYVAGRQPAELSGRKGLPTIAAARLGAKATNLQWTLSPKGSVQRSSDSGKTWQPVSFADAAGFRAVALSAIGANVWVGGKAGALYHSPDAGQTWIRVEPAAGSKKLDHDIVSVDFSDALVGTVNTANGEVWTTSDGGQTWVFDKQGK